MTQEAENTTAEAEKEQTLEEILAEVGQEADEEQDADEAEAEEAGEEEAEDAAETEEQSADDAEVSEEEADRLKKQEAYRERQKKKAEQSATGVTDDGQSDEDKEALEYARNMYQQAKMAKLYEADKQALSGMEAEFKEVFTDYDEVMTQALEFSELRLMEQGYSEQQAKAIVEQEKILLANKAAVQGLDPVDVLYKEAKSIVSFVNKFMEKKGVKSAPEKKVDMAAVKEISKPSAMTGGKGRGATAVSRKFNDYEDLKEVEDTPLHELMK